MDNKINIIEDTIKWLNSVKDITVLTDLKECFSPEFDLSKVNDFLTCEADHFNSLKEKENYILNKYIVFYIIFLLTNKYPTDIWGENAKIKFYNYIAESEKYIDTLKKMNLSMQILSSVNKNINLETDMIRANFVNSLYESSKYKNFLVLEFLTLATIEKNYRNAADWLKIINENEKNVLRKPIFEKKLELKKFNLYATTFQGLTHTKCDDNASIEEITKNIWVAYSADGVGSKIYSNIGSKIAGECLIYCIKKAMLRKQKYMRKAKINKSGSILNYILNDLSAELSKAWNKRILNYISEMKKSEGINAEISDFATTLLFACGDNKNIVCGIIGDGNFIIERAPYKQDSSYGYIKLTDGFSSVVQKAVLGIHHLKMNENLIQFYVFKSSEVSSIFISSDGADGILYEKIGNASISKNINLLYSKNELNILRRASFDDCLEKIKELALNFSSCNKYRGGRGDDCSIVFIKNKMKGD